MKIKQRILSVVMILAMVVSLIAVMVAPAGAVVSAVTVTPTVTGEGAASIYTVVFTTGAIFGGAAQLQDIVITFPVGTTTANAAIAAGTTVTGSVDGVLAVTSATGALATRTATIETAASTTAVQTITVVLPATMVTANPAASAAHTATVATNAEAAVASAVYTITDSPNTVVFAPTPNTAGTASTWAVSFTASSAGALVANVSTIAITFPSGTTVPSTISKNYVSMSAATGAIAVDPIVSGRVVTLVTDLAVANNVAGTVTFAQTAGILNPTLAKNTHTGTVSTSADAVAATSASMVIRSTVSRSPSSGASGTTVTVTGSGLNASKDYTVFQNSARSQTTPATDVVVASGTTESDGTFSVTFSATATGYLWVRDGKGLRAPTTVADMPLFTKKPKIAFNIDSGSPGTTVVVTASAFTASSTFAFATAVTVGQRAAVMTAVDNTALIAAAALSATGAGTYYFRVPAVPAGAYTVRMTDAAGLYAEATFTVNNFYLTPSSRLSGKVVTVYAKGFVAGSTFAVATAVNVGGTAAPLTTSAGAAGGIATAVATGTTAGTATLYFAAPAKTAGDYTVVLTNSAGQQATSTLTISTRDLTLTPSSGPRGTKVTLTAGSMTANGEVDPNGVNGQVAGALGSATIASQATLFSSTQSTIIDSGGNLQAITVTVPATDALGAFYDENTVRVTDSSGLYATGKFTVVKPYITITPTSGYMGTTVTVNGYGWNAGSRGSVTVGGGVTPISSIPAADGTFSASFTVPASVGIGPTSFYASAYDALGNVATAIKFTVSAAAISLSPVDGAIGTEVTVTGAGYLPSSPLTALTIGSAPMLQGRTILTDTYGAFTATLTVPGLATGAQTVLASIGGSSRTAFFSVTAAPVTVSTALASVSGKYTKVWSFDAATQAWQLFDTAAPAVSDLTSLTRGQGYWIESTEDTSIIYSGNTYALVEGWNLIGWLG